MIKLVGLLLVLNALIATGWWVATDQPGKGWVFTVCLAALFSGAFLLLQDRATEITVKGVGTIRAAAEKASIDAEAVAELRERVEAQSATVDLVAQQAAQARNLSEQLSAKLGTAESRVEALDSALEKANQKVAELDQISAFTSTVIAAQNDDRHAFDRLENWANDANHPLREEALSAYRTVLDEHAKPFHMSGFTVPWQEGFDPSQLSIEQLGQQYRGAPVWLRPALIEYVWNRDDFPELDRLAFLAGVVRGDSSLNAVEFAGRILSGALEVNLKPLATKQLLQAWQEKKRAAHQPAG